MHKLNYTRRGRQGKEEKRPWVYPGAALFAEKELIIGNIILLGEVPSYAGTWQSDDETASTDYNVRARFFSARAEENFTLGKRFLSYNVLRKRMPSMFMNFGDVS